MKLKGMKWPKVTHWKLLAVPAHLLPKPLLFPFFRAQGPTAIRPVSIVLLPSEPSPLLGGLRRPATLLASHFHHNFPVFPLAPSLRLSPSWLPWVIPLNCSHRSQPPVDDCRGRAQGPSLHKKKAMGIRSDQICRSVVSDSLRPHESQYARPPCPSPTPGVH